METSCQEQVCRNSFLSSLLLPLLCYSFFLSNFLFFFSLLPLFFLLLILSATLYLFIVCLPLSFVSTLCCLSSLLLSILFPLLFLLPSSLLISISLQHPFILACLVWNRADGLNTILSSLFNNVMLHHVNPTS